MSMIGDPNVQLEYASLKTPFPVLKLFDTWRKAFDSSLYFVFAT